MFYQDILSKKLLNSDDAKTEVFLKLLSDNLKFQLLVSFEKYINRFSNNYKLISLFKQNVDETKLEHLLKLNDLKEVNKNEWSKLYKNKAFFPSEVCFTSFSMLDFFNIEKNYILIKKHFNFLF